MNPRLSISFLLPALKEPSLPSSSSITYISSSEFSQYDFRFCPNRGKSFYEWQMAKKGISYKKRLKDNIDTVIPLVDSYDAFLAKMKDLG